MIALKPQDTLLALKYWSLRRNRQHLAVRDMADALQLSANEVSRKALWWSRSIKAFLLRLPRIQRFIRLWRWLTRYGWASHENSP
jgi:hypothetical protein